MKQPIYIVVGTPGSGKSWVCEQLDGFSYLPHDSYKPDAYLKAAMYFSDEESSDGRPVLIETPFSVSQIVEPLTKKGYKVIPVFIIETAEVTAKRYEDREGKPIPQGHLTRIETYRQRAKELGAFSGTSSEVLEHLEKV